MSDLSGKRLAAYARYSSELQSDMSIDDQLDLLRVYVEKNGGRWDDVEVFRDAAKSASSLARPGVSALRAKISKGRPEFDIVLTECVDRLSRDMADSAYLLREFTFAEVRLIAVSDGIDMQDASARLQYGIRAVMAEQYLADLSKKTRRGLHGRASRGYATGGLPFGYDSARHIDDKGKSTGSDIVIHAEEAQLVRRIFRMFVEGRSYLSIVTTLNEEEIETPRGAKKRNGRGWVDTTVRAIVRNAAYIGQWTYGERRWLKEPETGRRRYRPAPEEDIQRFERPHLRIIDDRAWKAAQERIEATMGKYSRCQVSGAKSPAPTRRTRYPLSGLLFCGECEAPMVIVGGSTARYYRCVDVHKRGTCSAKRSVREDHLSTAVISRIKRQLLEPQAVAYLAEMLKRKSKNASGEAGGKLQAAKTALARVQTRSLRLVEAVASGAVKGAALAALSLKLESEERSGERLEAEVQNLKDTLSTNTTAPTVDELTTNAEALIQNLDGLLRADPVKAREQIRKFIPGGRITMSSNQDGSWTANFRLSAPLLLEKTTKRKNPGVSSGAVYFSSCAGKI